MLYNDCAPACPIASPGFGARGWFCRCQRLPFFAKPRPLSLQCMYRYAPRDSALRFQARVLVPASPLSSLSGFRETLPLLLSATAAAERCRCCCCRCYAAPPPLLRCAAAAAAAAASWFWSRRLRRPFLFSVVQQIKFRRGSYHLSQS